MKQPSGPRRRFLKKGNSWLERWNTKNEASVRLSTQPRPPVRAVLQFVGVVSAVEEGFASVLLPWLAPPHLLYQGDLRTSAQMMQPRDNKRARLLPSAALGTLDCNLLIRCASYLDADGLAQLGRTSARFGMPQAGQQRSLANEAAHLQFRQSATDEERGSLPKYGNESDIGLCRALEQLRQPLRFDELVGNGFGHQEHPARVTCKEDRRYSSAISGGHVMRVGRHFVELSITIGERRNIVNLGVIRPVSLTDAIDLEADWEGSVHPVTVSSIYEPAVSEKLRSQRTSRWGDSNVHCCTYYCYNGRCSWTDWDNYKGYSRWQGHEGLEESGTIGLLLDLNEGNLSVFKNGRRLGVMKDGLNGEYCWFVTARSACMISMSKGRAPS